MKASRSVAEDMLASLKKRGVHLRLENGQLRFRAPNGTLVQEELSTLRERKSESLDILQPAPQGAKLVPRSMTARVSLTAMQSRWIKSVLREQRLSSVWGSMCRRLIGALYMEVLLQSVETLISRHESLRTRKVRVGDGIVQHVELSSKCRLDLIDLTDLSSERAFGEAVRRTKAFILGRIDICIEALLTWKVYKLETEEYALLFLLDHLISDHDCKHIVVRELWTAYRDVERQVPFSIPSAEPQFPDYVCWRERKCSAWFAAHADYWTRKFVGALRLRLPADQGMPEIAEHFAYAVWCGGDARGSKAHSTRKDIAFLHCSSTSSRSRSDDFATSFFQYPQ
jgi:hypothetical protein